MKSTSLFMVTALAIKVQSLGTFGGLDVINPIGQYLPPTGSYSNGPYKQAVFLSFDGMHQFDLVRYIATHPDSAWAKIVKNAVVYSNARGSSPSDSLPGTSALFSGTSPRNSGIFWETVYDRSLYPPGSNCVGPPGTVADYSEAVDLDITMLDGGGGFNLSTLPQQKTSWGTCAYVYPHDFIRTNTIFEVGRGNGLVTAYADKHLAYEFLNGPSGVGLSEGYFPEVASVKGTLTGQEGWDDLHWSALRNWTNGGFVNGTKNPDGGPSLYAANFQSISSSQQKTGYLDAVGTPNKTLESAFEYIDSRLEKFLDDLKAADKLDSTLLLLGAKHGQGPVDPKILVVTDPQTVIDGTGVPVALFVGEDGGIMWLANASDTQTAKANLLANKTLGISYVLAGDEVTLAGFGSPYLDPRVPDLVIGAKVGTLWNTGFEFEDHGGFLPQDLNVPLLAYNPKLKAKNITEVVSNRQVASTMLQALGLPLAQLDGFRLGESPVLPHLFDADS